MSRSAVSLALLLAITHLAGICRAEGDTSTKQEFQEWIELMKGRWIGDIPLVQDWPGLGKRGDRLTAYSDIEVIADGHALQGVWYAGDGKASWMTTWNPSTKQIKENVVFSSGITWENVITKQAAGKWLARKVNGSMPDGKQIDGDVTLTISDDGKTHTWTGEWTVDGVKTDQVRDVYRRLAD
jgi:hypothetical protein